MDKKKITFDYTKFMYVGEDLNIIIEMKYFKKLKDYTDFIIYMINLIDTTITLKMTNLNNNTLDVTIDLIQYKLKEIDFDFIKMLILSFQDKYPDNLNKIYITNTTIVFKGIYKLLKPFICKETRAKILFENKNKQFTNDLSI